MQVCRDRLYMQQSVYKLQIRINSGVRWLSFKIMVHFKTNDRFQFLCMSVVQFSSVVGMSVARVGSVNAR